MKYINEFSEICWAIDKIKQDADTFNPGQLKALIMLMKMVVQVFKKLQGS